MKKTFYLLGMLILSTIQGVSQGFSIVQQGSAMDTPRYAHSAVLLPDGNVLVAGGHTTGFALTSTASIYDVAQNSWTQKTTNYSHDGGAVAKLNDGKFLFAGGAGSALGVGQSPFAELYDPATGQFTPTGNTMTTARFFCTATTLTNGKVLMVGNWYGDASTAELFDASLQTFSATGATLYNCANPLVFPTSDGGAIVLGGTGNYGGNTYTEEVDYYNPATNQFSQLQSTIITGDPGWKAIWSSQYGITENYRIFNGKYVFLANKTTGSRVSFRIVTFDPDTKEFNILPTTPSLPDYQVSTGELTYLISDLIVSNNKEMIYLPAGTGTTPYKAGMYAVDLTTSELIENTAFHTFGYYFTTGTQQILPGTDDKILICGGSINGTNFDPVDSAYIIKPELSIGIEEFTGIEFIQVYPNPAVSEITVSWEQSTQPVNVQITDISGRLLIEKTVENTASTRFDINVLGKGSYLVSIHQNDKIQHRLFVKQ